MWAVAAGYLAPLPRRKVVLGGASKINVLLGPRPTVGIFSHSESGSYPDGIGWIWIESFDFNVLCEVDLKSQQLSLLNAIHDALLEVARRTQSDTSPFARTDSRCRTSLARTVGALGSEPAQPKGERWRREWTWVLSHRIN
jgi:hypothetical protein